MMISHHKWLACAGLVVAGLSANAQITKQGGGYLLRAKYVSGKKIDYVMDAKGAASGTAFTMRMPLKTKVTGVTKGIATITYVVGPIAMTFNGKPMNNPAMGSKAETVTIKMDSRGNVVGGDKAMSNVGSIGLPEKPIPVGGSWSATTDTPAGPAGTMKVNATYKLVGFETVGGIKSAKIAITLKGSGQANVKGSGTVWLAMADGSLVKNSTTMNVSTGGMEVPMTMSVTRK